MQLKNKMDHVQIVCGTYSGGLWNLFGCGLLNSFCILCEHDPLKDT